MHNINMSFWAIILSVFIFHMVVGQSNPDMNTKDNGEALAESPLSTHILDTTLGRPAAMVNIRLHKEGDTNAWTEIDLCDTDNDGRCSLLSGKEFTAGVYKLTFDTGSYFQRLQTKTFYPRAEVIFQVEDASEHYHVPLLLNPYSYSTYRGS